MSSASRSLSLLAPAKINLYLHVVGRREDGYHLLDSLVAFADVGDRIRIDPAPRFSFSIQGPFGHRLDAAARSPDPAHSTNLVVRAVHALAHAAGRSPDLHVSLTKNLPPGAGLGGGSSDAATVLWALMRLWGLTPEAPFLPALSLALGADVPVCIEARPARMQGIGERLTAVPALGECPLVIVWPGIPCPTGAVYRHFSGPFRAETPLPPGLEPAGALIASLRACGNDLTDAARMIVPEIDAVLAALEAQAGCGLSRLCGSGSACFGLFESSCAAEAAAEALTAARPGWWVHAGWLGRVARY